MELHSSRPARVGGDPRWATGPDGRTYRTRPAFHPPQDNGASEWPSFLCSRAGRADLRRDPPANVPPFLFPRLRHRQLGGADRVGPAKSCGTSESSVTGRNLARSGQLPEYRFPVRPAVSWDRTAVAGTSKSCSLRWREWDLHPRSLSPHSHTSLLGTPLHTPTPPQRI